MESEQSSPKKDVFHRLVELFGRKERPKKLERSVVFQFLICLAVISLHLFLFSARHFDRVENMALDYFFRQRSIQAVSPAIAIIEIDEASLQAIGRWPWPWRYYGELVDLLSGWGAKAIVFDSIFSEANVPYEDNALPEAMSKAGLVYLPVDLGLAVEKKIWVHSLPIVIQPGGEKKTWLHSARLLEKYAKGIGHMVVEPDADGVVRKISPILMEAGKANPYFMFPPAMDSLGKSSAVLGLWALPRDGDGKLWINWSGPWGTTFRRYRAADLVRSAQAMQQGLTPLVLPSEIRGKICLVGLTVPGLAQVKATPLEANSPVLGIHAEVLNNILQNRFLRPASRRVNFLCLFLVGLAASVFFTRFKTNLALLTGLLLGVFWVAFSFLIFWQKGIWFFVFQPLFLILTLFVVATIYDRFETARERIRLLDLATRDGLTGLYVIRYFREVLNQLTLEAHDAGQHLSLILMDLDNFKSINDTYGHPVGDKVLKKVAQILSTCVRSKRPSGKVDFVGRYGGEEFIVLLRGCDLNQAASNIAERIRKAVEAMTIKTQGTVIPVTLSLGVATLHPRETIPDGMVRRADESLYRSKRRGKNCVSTEAMIEE